MEDRPVAMCSETRSRLDALGRSLLPAFRVIPGREAALLEALRSELDRLGGMCAGLRAEVAAVLEAARQKGYEEGYAEARSEAIHLLAEAVRARREIIERAAAESVDLAFALAEKAMGREIDRSPDLLLRDAGAWVEACAGDRPYTVAMNPADVKALDEAGCTAAGAGLVPDPSLPRGVCRIDLGDTVFEAGYGARLGGIRDAAT
jgi:flagellar biosynthesis/type III secretory pathway protein FliH